MIDIHCHILPDMDDGPQSLDESLKMAKKAVEEGIHTIIATPHHGNARFHNPANRVRQSVKQFNKELAARHIPLKVIPGQEIYCGQHIIDDMDESIVQPIDGGKYILIEFPDTHIPEHARELFHELRMLDITPIIAHPERNRQIVAQPGILYPFIEEGALCQVTAQSIIGTFGRKIQRTAMKLCKSDMVHFVASDAHNVSTRPFRLKEAYETIHHLCGEHYVLYYQNNAECLIGQKPVLRWAPRRRESSKLLFWQTKNSRFWG